MKQEGETTLTTVKEFLKNNGKHLNNGGLLSILQKTKDDGVGSIMLCVGKQNERYSKNKHNCVYTANIGGYIQLFIHKHWR